MLKINIVEINKIIMNKNKIMKVMILVIQKNFMKNK